MSKRSLVAAGALAGGLLLAGSATAAPGTATGNVNMRTGPGTQYGVVTTVPAGAPVEVLGCQSWCQVVFNGRQGYVSANYIASGYAQAPVYQPRYYQAPVVEYYRPAPRAYYGYDRRWDHRPYRDRYHDDYRYGGGSGGGIFFEFGR